MGTPWIAVPAALVIGGGLIYSATRATASVEEGRVFVRWMLAVFVCFIALVSLPVVMRL